MPQDTFAILAEPSRRSILDRLRTGEASVNSLSAQLQMTQPSVSKHLKVLKDAGFVSSRTDAQRRIYQLEFDRIKAIDAWLEPYRELWSRHLDALERHLDRKRDH
ncbi:helix-turn-helix transcriptional regulator [Rhodobacter sp. SY28-1]|uniref:ArsR/SmtB family transcription factor n=1 Tax=Rhodobacter sp. SY28-1 TaxID=2562317 RepID=UPI0010C0C3CE|nr:metalloregulator ArsR/SmtB family transcription factor [Rhodobacter sp. SY28-1]